MSGRELFLSDASLFVDDAEAYEDTREKNKMLSKSKDPSTDGPSSSTLTAHDAEGTPDHVDDDDDDDLDMDELNELEASLSRTTLQIKEPGDNV
ncbi:hypothetical protein Pfo_028814 [Paulownia fortunei]|nr:hypothetical protein Pfo_028814 [Paulownia fortunei]